MKKVFSIIVVLLLALVLVGCQEEDTYTQAEVDDLLYVLEHEIGRLETRDDEINKEIDTLFATIGALEDIIFENEARLNGLEENYYSKEELDEIFDLDESMPTVQDFVDFIDDFEDYVGQLKTRIDEYDEEYVQRMYDDFEDLVEVVIEYYETTNQEVSLETYIAQNYPVLYDRIMGY